MSKGSKRVRKNGTTPAKKEKPKALPQPSKVSPQVAMKPKTNFGPISTINTAPVAIGNSIRGATKMVKRNGNIVTITGRDFMFSPVGTSGPTTTPVLGWALVGGVPLTPAAFADSIIGNHMRSFTKFRFRKVIVHYITSSPTSANGDVIFYYSPNRESCLPSTSSSQFLAFVLTNSNTVFGPQWVNHSAAFAITTDWKQIDYGIHTGINEYAAGEIFLMSKTSTADSPGYVMFDYILEFAEEQLQPRFLSFPIARIGYFATTLTAAFTFTAGTTIALAIGGNNISGNVATAPPGLLQFDVYKIILDMTNSVITNTWTGATPSNIFQNTILGQANGMILSDGEILYAVYVNSKFEMFTTPENAFTGTNVIQAATTGSQIYGINVLMSYIGTLDDTVNVPNM